MEKAATFIPKAVRHTRAFAHPWLDEESEQLIQAKNNQEGSGEFLERQRLCSQGLLHKYHSHIARTQAKIMKLPSSSTRWWKLCESLMMRGSRTTSIPPLLAESNEWVHDATGKAELFAEHFSTNYTLPEAVDNQFSWDHEHALQCMAGFLPIRRRLAFKLLRSLREDSATGPDMLPTRILKYCAKSLALPISIIMRLILLATSWPESWKLHWLPDTRLPDTCCRCTRNLPDTRLPIIVAST